MEMVYIDAAIKKSDLREVSKLRGDVTRREVVIDGVTYEPTALVFCGFSGGLDVSDGLYHGKYSFRLSQPKDAERDLFSVADLPGMAEPPVETPDVIHEADKGVEDDVV